MVSKIVGGCIVIVVIDCMVFMVLVVVGVQFFFYIQILEVGCSLICMLVEVWSDDLLFSEWCKVIEVVFVFVVIDGSGCICLVLLCWGQMQECWLLLVFLFVCFLGLYGVVVYWCIFGYVVFCCVVWQWLVIVDFVGDFFGYYDGGGIEVVGDDQWYD